MNLELLAHAVGELDETAQGLEQEVAKWTPHLIDREIRDPGPDPVSIQLGANMRTMAGRAGVWLAEFAAQVRAAHAAMQAQLESYRAVDEEIAGRMRRS